MSHTHPDALTVDPKDAPALREAARVASTRWRTGWRVRPCEAPRCPVWVWRRPADDDAGDPTGGR